MIHSKTPALSTLQKLLIAFSVVCFLLGIFLISTSVQSWYISAHPVTIEMTKSGFSPSIFTITKGTVVVFKNVDNLPHWPASNIHPTHTIYPEFDPKREVAPTSSWSFQFQKIGQWRFHDHVFPDRGGMVFVQRSLTDTLLSFFKNSQTSVPTQSYTAQAISKDALNLLTNDQALYSYVGAYGPQQTDKRLNELSKGGGSCHQQAHRAGRFAFEIYGAKAFGLCSAECQSGCYHGAVEAYFRLHGTANLSENIQSICADQTNPFTHFQCIHGIGHGLMAWTNYQLMEALHDCDYLGNESPSCQSGVFMENVVGGLDPLNGHTTKYLNSNPQFPCTIVDDNYKSACYFYQTSRMLQLFSYDFRKVASECLLVPSNYQSVCFQSMGRDVDGANQNKAQEEIRLCSYAPQGQNRNDCIQGVANDAFWDTGQQDQAISICKLAQDRGEKDACYQSIIDRATSLVGKNQIAAFCSKFEGDYKNPCTSKLSSSQSVLPLR